MTYWAWQELNPDDGRWGLVAAASAIPGVGHGPLITRRPEICRDVFGPIALEHQARTGHRVRMVRLELGMTLMEYDEKGSRVL